MPINYVHGYSNPYRFTASSIEKYKETGRQVYKLAQTDLSKLIHYNGTNGHVKLPFRMEVQNFARVETLCENNTADNNVSNV